METPQRNVEERGVGMDSGEPVSTRLNRYASKILPVYKLKR